MSHYQVYSVIESLLCVRVIVMRCVRVYIYFRYAQKAEKYMCGLVTSFAGAWTGLQV
jgi:hypothetical protein